jgi:hypothetical protein
MVFSGSELAVIRKRSGKISTISKHTVVAVSPLPNVKEDWKEKYPEGLIFTVTPGVHGIDTYKKELGFVMRSDRKAIGEVQFNYTGDPISYHSYDPLEKLPKALARKLATLEVLEPSAEELAYYASQETLAAQATQRASMRASSASLTIPNNTGFSAFTSAAPVYTMKVTSIDNEPQNDSITTTVPSGTHTIGWAAGSP